MISDLTVRVYMGFRASEHALSCFRALQTGSCFFLLCLFSALFNPLLPLLSGSADEPEKIKCLWCLHSTSPRGKLGNPG